MGKLAVEEDDDESQACESQVRNSYSPMGPKSQDIHAKPMSAARGTVPIYTFTTYS